MAGEALRPDVQAVVAEFADALDADDFDVVQRRLATDCVYLIGGQRHVGPEAVVASYRDGSHLARRLFEEVVFTIPGEGEALAAFMQRHSIER
jgi:hypothetical protein